jgi:hypothetical protein
MRAFSATFALCLLSMAALGTAAQAVPSEYGIDSFSASASTSQAGAHPDFSLDFALKTEKDEGKFLPATTRDVSIDLPPGLLANPNAVPKCSAARLTTTDVEDPSNKTGCPQDAQVGITKVVLSKGVGPFVVNAPIYNMESPGGDVAARLGFIADVYAVFVDAHLRSDGDYGATVTIEGAGSLIPLFSASTTTWGVPADESHDSQRITPYEAVHGGLPETPSGKRPSGLVPVPFMVNPTRCGVAREVRLTATSYALPDQPAEATAPLPSVTGCGKKLDFSPKIDFRPAGAADSPSGMDVTLSLPQEGLEYPNLLAEAHLKRVVSTLPAGLTLNPASASGLDACSEEQIGLISRSPIRFDKKAPGCPDSSKVGTVEIETPLLPKPLPGSLYVARQVENPFGSLLAGYLAIQDQGVTIKLAGRFDIDPATQRITATFDENPQAPFGKVSLHLKGGARGVLITPPSCGGYAVHSAFSPWSALDPFNPTQSETVEADSPFQISSGPEGGACPGGRFDPTLEAWTTKPTAAAYSPFVLRLARQDGSQRFARVSVSTPPGLVAKLAGVPYCPESAIAAVEARGGLGQGALERVAPACPAASRVGDLVGGAGAGPTPLFLDTGRAYLAGPYRGAPLSLLAVFPAVAGPFDLGAVVTRIALNVNPRTARVTATSDPLPTVLHGIPLDIRDIRLVADRRKFILNPTSCAAMQIAATVTSEEGKTASPKVPFEVGGCRDLRFKPRLSMRLFGKTNRGAHPRFRAVLRPRPGDANIKRISVALPRSEFLEQAHIGTVCTRVQFAADRCPKGAIYGHAQAFSPLLDRPLKGPVYLRSSSHVLPDLVIALDGQIEIEAVGRIDSIKGGIRTTFTTVPDAPVTKVVLDMPGGKKGLLVNSRNLCLAPARAMVALEAHNGRSAQINPLLRNDCAKSARRHTPKNR